MLEAFKERAEQVLDLLNHDNARLARRAIAQVMIDVHDALMTVDPGAASNPVAGALRFIEKSQAAMR